MLHLFSSLKPVNSNDLYPIKSHHTQVLYQSLESLKAHSRSNSHFHSQRLIRSSKSSTNLKMPKTLLQTAIQKSLPNLPVRQQPREEGPQDPLELKFTEPEMALLRKSWNSSNLTAGKGCKKAKPPASPTSATHHKSKANSALQTTSMMFGSAYFWIEVYEELVKRDPEVSLYMPTAKHMTVQFSSIMLTAMENLEDLSSLQYFLQKLGSMHARVFSVEQKHFELLGQALLQILIERVKELPIVQLWMRLYCFIANTMLTAANDFTLDEELVAEPLRVTFYPELMTVSSASYENISDSTSSKDSSDGRRKTATTLDSTDSLMSNLSTNTNDTDTEIWSPNEEMAQQPKQHQRSSLSAAGASTSITPIKSIVPAPPNGPAPAVPNQGVILNSRSVNSKVSKSLGIKFFGKAFSSRERETRASGIYSSMH